MKYIAKRALLGVLVLAMLLSMVPALSPQAEAFTPEHSIIRVGLNAHRSWNPTPNVRLDNADGLRVGSFNNQRQFVASAQTSHTQLTVSASNGTLTVTNAAGETVASGASISIAPVSATRTTTYTLPNASFGGNVRADFQFFGGFRFNAQGNVMTAINYVDLEDYIKGVVPYEAVPSWPIEVLKAQAVTARTFAVANFGRNGSHGFDLSNSTFDQVYRGMHGANANTNRAVTETRGRVIVHNGRPIEAVYHAASGGATEDSINVWVSQLPYLRGVPDPLEVNTRPAAIQWSRTLTADEFLTHMRARVSNFGLNDIADIQTELTAMGNMHTVTFVASNGQTRSFSRSAARTSVLTGLHPTFNSQRFTITRNAAAAQMASFDLDDMLALDDIYPFEYMDLEAHPPIDPEIFEFHSELEIMQMVEDGLLSTHIATAEAIEAFNAGGVTFTVRNYGFGHGVGMSQWGAAAMAHAGYSYVEIIHHYYTDVTIVGGGQTNPPPGNNSQSSGNFTDVQSSDWFYPHVSYVREHGLMNGISNTQFAPRQTTTRAEFIAILGRMSGFNAANAARPGIVNIAAGTVLNFRSGPGVNHGVIRTLPAGTNITVLLRTGDWYRVTHDGQTGYVSRQFITAPAGWFSDVSPAAWYAPYVRWAQENNVTSGVGDNRFAPGATLTRQQMAVLLYNYINDNNITLNRNTSIPAFTDINSVEAWARPAVVALQQADIVRGMGAGQFAPHDTTDRASVASLIMHFHQQYG